jgi:hypothetical protein
MPSKSAEKEEDLSRRRTAPKTDPLGQSPDDPIEFTANNEVARGNEERANAEPEPPALSSAKTPGVPDPVEKRRTEQD